MIRKHFLTHLCLIALTAVALTSCSDDDDPDYDVVLNLNSSEISYDNNGVWDQCYSTTTSAIVIDDFVISHAAFDWGGFFTWYGFCPSKSSDATDYTTGNWIEHQWSAITRGGVDGVGTPYLVGCWSSSESSDLPEDASCVITYDGAEFEPDEVYVTNNTYAYYIIKNGNAYSKVFTDDDWFNLIITGYNSGRKTGSVTVSLANGTDILNRWKEVELDALGTVTALVFTMESSDTGVWGMNTPSYFCLDRLKIEVRD